MKQHLGYIKGVLILLVALFGAVGLGCQQAEHDAPPKAASNTAASVKSLSPEGGDKATDAEFNGYPYSFTKEGEKTIATFGPKPLPPDRDFIVGAMRDVIYRSYGDKADSAPRVEGTGNERSIYITGNKHEYLVVVGRDQPAGEIQKLIITRQN